MAETIAKAVFGLLFERSTEVVLVAERATQVVLAANPPAEELLAAGRADVIGRPFSALLFEPERDLSGAGHYEDVGLRRSDDYPVYVELEVIHVDDPVHGALIAYIARDTTERRILQLELVAKHTALHGAYAELERAHAQLTATKLALERSNREIASLSFRLFGNIFAGEVLVAAMAAILAFGLPIPFMFFEVMVGAIQALIFAMLILTYITMMTAAEEH